MAFLELNGVAKSYGDTRALDGFSLEVREGELVTLLGPSGSGKSTALRIVAGLETADAGEVRIGGVDVTGVEASERGISMVFQSFALFPHMSVAENIGFGLAARRTPAAEVRRLVEEVADWLALAPVLDRRPSQLSGGERQRVALARGMVRRPRLLLMDEPLSNLDAKLRVQTRAEIRRIHAQAGITLLYVTHDQAEALSLGDRVAIIDGGRLQQHAAPAEVYEHPANRFVAGFLGNPPMNLLPARVDGASVQADGIRVRRDEGARPLDHGRQVLLGFRPEHVVVAGPAHGVAAGDAFEAVLEVSEHVGHERLWYLRVGEREVIARPGAEHAIAEGTRIRASVQPAGVRLFDPADGKAL